MMGEALIGGTSHADNVGPAVLGGVVLIRGYEPLDIVRLPVPEGFFYAVVHPDIVVSTKQAREVLPREVPLHDAVTQWGNVGGLVAGFALGDVALIGRSMHDVVAEPYRKGFIPGYDVLKEGVLAEGALAMNIAGSGLRSSPWPPMRPSRSGSRSGCGRISPAPVSAARYMRAACRTAGQGLWNSIKRQTDEIL